MSGDPLDQGAPLAGGSFAPDVLAKSLHDTLDTALAAIPAGHTHALLFDGTYQAADGPAIRGVYVQRVPNGWNLGFTGGYDHPHGVVGQVELAKSW